MEIIKTSWRHTSCTNNNVIDTYICICGNQKSIIRDDNYIQYICSQCKNKIFLDTGLMWNDIDYLIKDCKTNNLSIEFKLDFRLQIIENRVIVIVTTKVPSSIDFVKDKIIYKDFTLCYAYISKNPQIINTIPFSKNNLNKIKSNIKSFSKDQKALRNCIKINMPNDNIYLKESDIYLFVNNLHLKDYEFIKWTNINILGVEDQTIQTALLDISNNIRAKSIKKAVLLNYQRQLNKYGSFDPMPIYIFSRAMTDINHLRNVIAIDFILDFIEDYNILSTFVDFLLHNYSEYQVLLYFKKVVKLNKYVLNDTLKDFEFTQEIRDNKFTKPKATPILIHDEFVRLARKKRYQYLEGKKLTYLRKEINACISFEEYRITLPSDGVELFEWADILHNCMASYFQQVQDHKTIIYGFFYKNKLKFAVEIKNNKIVQANAKYNSQLSSEDTKILNSWFEKYFHKPTIEPVELNIEDNALERINKIICILKKQNKKRRINRRNMTI